MSKNYQQLSRQELTQRLANTLDKHRQHQQSKRHTKGFNTARENLFIMCDGGDFNEYGQLAVAAQRQRKDYESLQTETAADGVITGTCEINTQTIDSNDGHSLTVAIIINDYSVLAGTQGYFHHLKLDRMIEVAEKNRLPVIMLTEGGGGRPGDTDITTINSGLQCTTFARWAGLTGKVPRIAINNGYCFAGNAVLFGSADITIATQSSCIGMAGPAMIEGGGLGKYAPTDIGPVDSQAINGVVDIVANDEDHAINIAKYLVGFFQGHTKTWQSPDPKRLDSLLPNDRRYAYDIRNIIHHIVDCESFIEIARQYGKSAVVGFARIEGRSVGVIANACSELGGAIDVDAAKKLGNFMTLCNRFDIPIVSLVDTPGFMVGPDHEKLGAVRHLSELFSVGATLSVPLFTVVIRKCYGLGAQAMLGGCTRSPDYTLSWPTGEFGAMGLEGAVKLGFKKELDSLTPGKERQALFDKLLAQQYEKGKAIEVASVLELDAVILPADTRKVLSHALSR